jgi:plastocyanin
MLARILAVSLAALAVSQAVSAAPAATPRLVATVGPNDTISLRTAAGAPVRALRAGVYTIVVRDRADDHNFRLRGPRMNRATGVAATGTTTWRSVRLVRGAYTFLCEPHSDDMRGAFRVR